MRTRKANDDSHFLFFPLPHKAREKLSTTSKHSKLLSAHKSTIRFRAASLFHFGKMEPQYVA